MVNDLANVLMIEDNPGDVRLVRERLAERLGAGCALHAAETLGVGLAWLTARSADVILLDLSLPDSQGLQTYFSVHEHAPATPVVILSGRDDDQLALDAVRAGAADYLAKQHADGIVLARTLRHAVERRRTERALRDSEARYRSIVETAEEGILQLDAQGRVRYVNARMAHMFGLPIEALVGSRFVDLVEHSYTELARHLLADCVRGGRRTAELRFVRTGPEPLWALVAAGAIHAPDGEALDLVVMLSDISGRVLAEQELVRIARELEVRVAQRTAQLEAANTELQLYNQSIAHDLRTPLNAILGFASLLEHDADTALSPAAQRQLRLIQHGARDMNELIGGLLALSHVGRVALRHEPLDLSALAAEITVQLRGAEPQREVEVVIEPGVRGAGDPSLLRSLLDNLIGNAWKYTGQSARPRLSFGLAPAASGETVYRVVDNGVGFDMQHMSRLFMPFERLASARAFPGTGIGLATARRIVERHGGRIWAESQPNERTCFFFTLGIAPA